MSITEARTASGNAAYPGPSSQLLQFREGERPENGPDTIAQTHLQNAEVATYEPVPSYEATAIAVRGLTGTVRDADPAAAKYAPTTFSRVTRDIMRADPQLRERGLPMSQRIRHASSAVQLSLRPLRQPVSELEERTILAGLDFLEAQRPKKKAPEELDEDTSALIEGFGYVVVTAAQTEHFTLVRFATDRIDYLTSRLRGPKPNTAPNQTYLEAMAILHSSLATRAYALLRLYGEQLGEHGHASADNELLLQARKDESRVMGHFVDRSTKRPVQTERGLEDVRYLPQANSGYASWDVRAMRYIMGYHYMDDTPANILTRSDIYEFLEAVTSEKVAMTAASTAAAPLLSYLGDSLGYRVLMPLPKSTREALAHDAEQELKTYKMLLHSRY